MMTKWRFDVKNPDETGSSLPGGADRSSTDQALWNNIVITARAVHVSIRQIGNSQGVVIPKPVLAQLGLDATAGVEMTIEDGGAGAASND